MAEPSADGPPPFELTPEGLTETVAYYSTVAVENFVEFAPRLVAAGLILWIGAWISGRIHKAVYDNVIKSPRIDTTLGAFFARVVRYALMAGVILLAVSILGVEVASIFVLLSAMTLAIGLALQGSLGNVAAGLIVIVLRPYRIGDYVELAGEEGIVEEINLFTTSLRRLDNVKVILSNGDVRANTIRNYSSLGVRRIDVDFGIDYGDDIGKAQEIILKTATAHKDVLNEPEGPWAKVALLNNSSVDIQMRVWVRWENYWETRFDLIRAVKEAFDAGGITIPYPQAVEYIRQDGG